jgi:hypothetical protein
MIVIDVHRTATEYVVVRTTKGRAAPEWISCGSWEELPAVLLMLGVTHDGLQHIFDQLEERDEAEWMV